MVSDASLIIIDNIGAITDCREEFNLGTDKCLHDINNMQSEFGLELGSTKTREKYYRLRYLQHLVCG